MRGSGKIVKCFDICLKAAMTTFCPSSKYMGDLPDLQVMVYAAEGAGSKDACVFSVACPLGFVPGEQADFSVSL